MQQLVIPLICMSIYIAFFGYYFIIPILGAAPYYPSNKDAIKKMTKLANIQSQDKVIDLGSGDGRVVLAASNYSENVTGIELNIFFCIISKILLILKGKRKKTRIIWGNFYKHDFSRYDIIMCYLLPSSMKKLQNKFQQELKPGAIVVTNTFHLEEFKLIKEQGKIKVYQK